MLESVLESIRSDVAGATERLTQFLKIPSVGTDPAFNTDTARAADFVGDALRAAGLETTVHPTGGHPVVLATTPPGSVPDDAPHILYYGHYDVQPPDPIDLWTTPPFEPTVRDGNLFARGACDDKGQLSCITEALRAWGQTGKWPARVTILVEGEEECGSVHLRPFIEAHRAQLDADIAVISDTAMWDQPSGPVVAITYGLRGLLFFDLELHNATGDLHSGLFGGVLANPANILVGVLARLFDDNQRVTIPGFYDDVQPVGNAERALWDQLDFDEHKQYLSPIGVTTPFGEAGYSTLERRWARPSCDINGLGSGYTGAGAKTVLPSVANAKVSFRLAPNQDSRKIAAAFKDWLNSQPVHGCRWKVAELGHAEPVMVPFDSPYVDATKRGVQIAAGHEAVLMREGATIPVVADFKSMLGLDSLLIGFGLATDQVHAPDERFGLDRFHLGCLTHAAVLAELANVHPPNRL